MFLIINITRLKVYAMALLWPSQARPPARSVMMMMRIGEKAITRWNKSEKILFHYVSIHFIIALIPKVCQ
jgi:hypothetical protein